MIAPIYEGIILGLVLAFSFGPGFFALINTGINHGFKSGAALAIGIFLSDLFLVFLIFLLLSIGAENILSDPKNQHFIGVVGGIVLIVYGSFSFINKAPKTDADLSDPTDVNHLTIETNLPPEAERAIVNRSPVSKITSPKPFWLGVKGFFLNLFNPFVWIFWMATSTAVASKFEFSQIKIIVFFTATLGVVLTTDLLKTFIANKIKRFLTNRLMRIINLISGAILILFGLYLIYKVFFLKH